MKGHVLRGVLVAELQQRGAVHYHFVTWFPKGITFPKPDKQGWWPHGMTQWQWARRPIGYLVKYSTKVDTKHRFPRGCRISGTCGLDRSQRMERRWWRLPVFVRRKWPDWRDDVIRAKGGEFLARAIGEVMPPLYSFLGISMGQVWLAPLSGQNSSNLRCILDELCVWLCLIWVSHSERLPKHHQLYSLRFQKMLFLVRLSQICLNPISQRASGEAHQLLPLK